MLDESWIACASFSTAWPICFTASTTKNAPPKGSTTKSVSQRPQGVPKARPLAALNGSQIEFAAVVDAVKIVSEPAVDLQEEVAVEETGERRVRHFELVAGDGIAEVGHAEEAAFSETIEQFGDELVAGDSLGKIFWDETNFVEGAVNDGAELSTDAVIRGSDFLFEEMLDRFALVGRKRGTLDVPTGGTKFAQEDDIAHGIERAPQRLAAERSQPFDGRDRVERAGKVGYDTLEVVKGAFLARPDRLRGGRNERLQGGAPLVFLLIIPIENPSQLIAERWQSVRRTSDGGPHEVAMIQPAGSVLLYWSD